MMLTKEVKLIHLNAAQVSAALSHQKNKYFEWSRGTGKSFILGGYIKDFVIQMPRATGALVGSTYMQILSRTLPSTKEGLEMFGLYENFDYVVGRSGAKLGFEMPFQAPNNWHNVIHFRNGAILVMVSLDMPNSGRGLNIYFVIGDEAALFDRVRLFENVQTTNRAKKAIFSKAPLLNAEIFASSTPLTREGQWFTKMEEVAKSKPNKYAFIKSNAFVNKHNLTADWFERMRINSPSKMHYDAEILNIRPKDVTNGFYPQLGRQHYYEDVFNNDYLIGLDLINKKSNYNCKQDNDLVPTKPLIISVDWGASINSMMIAQDINNEFRILKNFWVKSPKILDDLFLEEFIPYYKHHSTKTIHLYYDRNGNNATANSKLTFAQQAIKILKAAGWTVIVKTPRTLDPPHMKKFLIINTLLREDGKNNLPSIRINKHNCSDLITSLEFAEAKEGTKGIQKDKSSERSKTLPQEHATHLSDCFDLPIYWKYKDKIKTEGDSFLVPLINPIK